MREADDTELQAWVDGRLEPARRAAVEAHLAAHPDVAARLHAWREDARRLKAALGAATQAPRPQLDPAAVRRRGRARRRRLALLCASWLLALAIGALAGRQGRGAPPPMADAVEAYRVFATDRLRPVEMRADAQDALQDWMSSRLGRPLAVPDLGPYGFRLLGGRLLSTPDGAAALLLYESADGERLSFYLRPSRRRPDGSEGLRREDGLATRWWFRNGYGYAVVGRDDARTREVQAALPAAI